MFNQFIQFIRICLHKRNRLQQLNSLLKESKLTEGLKSVNNLYCYTSIGIRVKLSKYEASKLLGYIKFTPHSTVRERYWDSQGVYQGYSRGKEYDIVKVYDYD